MWVMQIELDLKGGREQTMPAGDLVGLITGRVSLQPDCRSILGCCPQPKQYCVIGRDLDSNRHLRHNAWERVAEHGQTTVPPLSMEQFMVGFFHL